MSRNETATRRGFTSPEKWIIWGVFCLLVALSTYRVSIFFGMMIASVGISWLNQKRNLPWAVVFVVIGISLLGLSFWVF